MFLSLARRVRATSMQLRNAAIDFAFPPACPLCGDSVTVRDGSSIVSFCQPCRGSLLTPVQFACDICGAPVGQYVNTSDGCAECGSGRQPYKRVVRLGLYEGMLRKACIKAKDAYQEPIMAGLARLLVEEQSDLFFDPLPDFLVPVPQHWRGRLASQHNASEVLASVLGSMLNLQVERQLLQRSRKTAPQKRTESIAARKTNQRDSFRIAADAIVSGKRVMLVDDILTTGATANEAARCLKKAGAKVVGIAVIARVLSKQLKK